MAAAPPHPPASTGAPGPARSPRVAAGLSALVPGLGQLYLGERPTGFAVLAAAVGILGGVLVAMTGPAPLRSWTTVALLVFVYPFLWVPAVRDAWRRGRGGPSPLLAGEQAWYVLFMLATVGPMALPLLWRSPRFSVRARRWWTAAVVAVALLGVAFTLWVGPIVERKLRELLEAVQGT
jgi:drug/metabolite transporter (DMT)-like permease